MLWVFRSNRVERLADTLADLLSRSVCGPMDMEWIGVSSLGMRVRLERALAQTFGVSSGMVFPFPREVFFRICRDETAAEDPFSEDAFVWSIFDILPSLLENAPFLPLRRYLADDVPKTKLFGLARQIAHVFSEYTLYRPQMVLEWEEGKGEDWQAWLWRALIDRHGSCHIARNASQFLKEPETRIRKLPFKKLSFFCVPTFSPLYISVLSTLARFMEVYLFALSPSMEWWADVKSTDRGTCLHHPLLASLGRTGSDFQWLLEENASYLEPVGDLHEDPATSTGATMLHALQSDILNLKSAHRSADRYRNDSSIRIHACAGPLRELEVIKNQLLDLFDNSGNTLSPDDIAVLAPDIRIFKPYIESVFASGENSIPFNIGASHRLGSSVIHAFLNLFDLSDRRLTVREVFDFLTADPVRQQFGFTAEDVVELEKWIGDAGVRWGMDREHRRAFNQPDFEENTWRFGLDRLLLSLAIAPESSVLVGKTAPCRTLTGDDRDRLAQLLNFIDILFSCLREMKTDRTPLEWAILLLKTASLLFNRNENTEQEHQVICKKINEWVKRCEAAGFRKTLSFSLVRKFLGDPLESAKSRKEWRPLGVTFADIKDLRGVPFSVICVVGLNAEDFPRHRRAPGFDLMTEHPARGDRSTADDDRYRFLETLLSARETLILTYRGRNIQDGTEIAPSSVVTELLGALKQSFGLKEEDVVVKHPISPFSPHYFGKSSDPRLFSYDSTALLGARAAQGEAHVDAPFFDGSLPTTKEEKVVDPDGLISFFSAPFRLLLSDRLGIRFPWIDALLPEREPMMQGGDDRRIVRLLLYCGLSGTTITELENEVRALGLLPLGQAGQVRFRRLCATVSPFLQKIEEMNLGVALEPTSVDICLRTSSGNLRIAGQVDGDRENGLTAFSLSKYDRVPALLSLYIRQLLQAVSGKLHGTTLLLSFDDGTDRTVVLAPPVNPEQQLSDLLSVYSEGMIRPLPLFPRISHKFVQNLQSGKLLETALKNARREWEKSDPGRRTAELTAFRGIDPFDPARGLQPSFEEVSMLVFAPIVDAVNRGKS